MADNTQNTGQTPGGNLDPSKVRSYLKNIIDDQEDLSGVLRDTLRELKKTETSYEKIQARLERISSGAIDVKAVQRDLNTLVDKEFIKRKQFEEIEREVGESKIDQLKNFKEEARLSVEQGKELGKKRDYNQELLALIEASEDHSIMQLFLSEQSLELAKKRTQEAEKQLDVEKKLSASLGIEGKLLKNFADKLGVGTEYYEEMSRKARKLNEEGKKFGFIDKVQILGKVAKDAFTEAVKSPLTYITAIYSGIKSGLNLAKQGLDSLTGTGGPFANFVSPFTNIIKEIPIVGGLIGGLVDAFANIMDFATGATSKIQEFARNLGLSFSEAKAINTQFEQIARNSGLAFVTAEKLTNSQLELSKELGINNILSNEILQDNIQLQEQVGLELDTRKQLAQVALIANTRQTQIFKTITGQVEAVRRSVGVNLRVQDIISKVSQLSGVIGLTFAKYPEKLTKSLAITKALGIDFQKLDSIASGLLDFESSIAAEFEAQLLTGKDINLGKARQLALDNDLTGLAIELNKQLGSSEEFINMNRIAQESYSKALGMSRDEIADMLRQQEFFAAAGATDLKTFKERISQMEKAGTLQSDFVSKLSEEQAQYFLSSTATEKIASFMEKIRQSFASLLSSEQFKSFLDTFLNKLADPNFLTGIINKITGFISIILKAVAAIVDVADVVGNIFSLGNVDIDNAIPNTIRSYANSLGGVSIGGAVANSQVGANMGTGAAGTSTSAAGGGSPQAINLTVQAVLDDHARKAELRMQRNPKADIKTGNIQ